jgi:hypothetical protein
LYDYRMPPLMQGDMIRVQDIAAHAGYSSNPRR